jgi:hypothetical protein
VCGVCGVCGGRGVCGVCGVCGGRGGVGVVGVWALWGCGVTPYVQHSTDCTCCDFGHLRFYIGGLNKPLEVCITICMYSS